MGLGKLINWFDKFQRCHGFFGFPIAVIRKYDDDRGVRQAALLTYYGFLAIFPLLLALEALLNYYVANDPGIQSKIVSSVTDYFPIVGDNLARNINTVSGSGAVFVFGLLVAIFGAHGIGDTFREGINLVWEIPRMDGISFPNTIFNTIGILFIGGCGFLLAPLLSAFAFSLGGHGLLVRVIALLCTLAFLFIVFLGLVRICLPQHVSNRELYPAAAMATLGLLILQSVGGYLLTHEVNHLHGLYGTFAVVLGLLLWIYLQAQMFFLSVEAASVRAMRLWPRALNRDQLTVQDKIAFKMYAKRNQFNKHEKIHVTIPKDE